MFSHLDQSYTWIWSALAGQAECAARLVVKGAWKEQVPLSLLCHSSPVLAALEFTLSFVNLTYPSNKEEHLFGFYLFR